MWNAISFLKVVFVAAILNQRLWTTLVWCRIKGQNHPAEMPAGAVSLSKPSADVANDKLGW